MTMKSYRTLSFSIATFIVGLFVWLGTTKFDNLLEFIPIGTARQIHGTQTTKTTDLDSIDCNGNRIANFGSKGQINLWNILSGLEEITIQAQSGIAVSDTEFDSDDLILANTNPDQIEFGDFHFGKTVLNQIDGSAITDLVTSSDSLLVASVGEDSHIALSNPRSGTATSLSGLQSMVTAIQFIADGSTLAVGGRYSQVVLWDLSKQSDSKQNEITRLPLGFNNSTIDFVFSPSGDTLALDGADARIILRDMQSA